MTLRPARPSDASSIAALSIEVWVGTYLRRGVSGVFADYVLETYTAENMRRLIADPDQHMMVSENTDGIDGILRVTPNAAPAPGCGDLEIATLYVQPRHHGRGIGKALLEAAYTHARTLAAPALWLTTNAQNTPAIGFYLANGFNQAGEVDFMIGDQGYLNNVYVRGVGPGPR